MKFLCRVFVLLPVLLCACASEPAKPVAQAPAPVVAPPPPAPVPDSISGRVASDDAMMPAHVDVKLLFGGEEVGRQTVDENGNFRFEGPLEKGRYDLTVHAGALHGIRTVTFSGGELKDVSVVIAKSEPRHRHRRRHRSDD